MQRDENQVALEEYLSSHSQIANCTTYESSDLSNYNDLINRMNSQLVIRSDDHFSEQESLQRPFFQFQGAIPTLISNTICNETINTRDTCDDMTWIETDEENGNDEMDCINKETIPGFTDVDGDKYFSCDDDGDQFYNIKSIVRHDVFDVNDSKTKFDDNQICVQNYETSEPFFNNMISEPPVLSYSKWDGDTESDGESVS